MADLGAIATETPIYGATVLGKSVSGTVVDLVGAPSVNAIEMHLDATGELIDRVFSRPGGGYAMSSKITMGSGKVHLTCIPNQGQGNALVLFDITPI